VIRHHSTAYVKFGHQESRAPHRFLLARESPRQVWCRRWWRWV